MDIVGCLVPIELPLSDPPTASLGEELLSRSLSTLDILNPPAAAIADKEGSVKDRCKALSLAGAINIG